MVEQIKYKNMKSIKKIYIALASVMILFSACIDPDNITPVKSEGGLLEVTTPSINLVVGETTGTDYTIEFKVFQEKDVKTTKVDAYVTFHSYKRNADGSLFWDVAEDGKDSSKVAIQSNEKLLKSIDISGTTTYFEAFSATFSDLISDLSVEGNDMYSDLPSSDAEYLIGDYWEVRFVNTLNTGDVHENYKRVKIAVSTRFAGTYKVLKGEYFRLGVDNGGGTMWVDGEVTISSIDAITYKFEEWGILSGWAGNVLYFQVNPVTLAITYPEEWDGTAQTLNGQPLTCLERNPLDLTNVVGFTTTPDVAVKDDVSGKDRLIMIHGYYTGGSGPREFFFELEKVVN